MVRMGSSIIVFLLGIAGNACSLNPKTPTLQQEHHAPASERPKTVNFFSRMHTSLRNTETAAYDMMYRLRDGVDSFIYDAQKDFYENYQK